MNTVIISILLITIIIVFGPLAILFSYDFCKYSKSNYKKESGNTYIKGRFNTGNNGEYLTFLELDKLPGEHKIITNAYIPKENGQTTEIDLIYIHETGIYIVESKNYSGWIFGDDEGKVWTQTFPNKRKETFYSPVLQNKTHIKHLLSLLQTENVKVSEDTLTSLIVFSKRCTLKKINIVSDNITVIKRDNIDSVLVEQLKKKTPILTNNDIDEIYESLKPFTCVSDDIKKNHIDNINNKNVKKPSVSKEDNDIKSLNEEVKVSENIIEKVEACEESVKIVNTKESIDKEVKSDDQLREELTSYRLTISTENNIKPYMVFNNSDLDLIIQVKPKTIDELKEMKGFGKVKCGKYGEDIINIVKKYTI